MGSKLNRNTLASLLLLSLTVGGLADGFLDGGLFPNPENGFFQAEDSVDANLGPKSFHLEKGIRKGSTTTTPHPYIITYPPYTNTPPPTYYTTTAPYTYTTTPTYYNTPPPYTNTPPPQYPPTQYNHPPQYNSQPQYNQNQPPQYPPTQTQYNPPPQQYPAQNSPPQQYPPQNSPPQQYPPQNPPPQQYPAQNHPPQQYPAQNPPPRYPPPHYGPPPPSNPNYVPRGGHYPREAQEPKIQVGVAESEQKVNASDPHHQSNTGALKHQNQQREAGEEGSHMEMSGGGSHDMSKRESGDGGSHMEMSGGESHMGGGSHDMRRRKRYIGYYLNDDDLLNSNSDMRRAAPEMNSPGAPAQHQTNETPREDPIKDWVFRREVSEWSIKNETATENGTKTPQSNATDEIIRVWLLRSAPENETKNGTEESNKLSAQETNLVNKSSSANATAEKDRKVSPKFFHWI